MTYLLDINVLIALVDPKHYGHEATVVWFRTARSSWATCPIVQNGFVRILSGAGYKPPAGTPEEMSIILADLIAQPGHEFWPDSISLLDESLVDARAITSHGRVTDVYLLALAVSRNAKLATLDRRLATSAVKGGSAALHVISAAAH